MTTEDVTKESIDEVVESEGVAEEAAPVPEIDPVAALTADLQRLQAEYANYRKRVERDRALSHELAISGVLTELLATLDDIERAQEHGELAGGFKSVAEQILATTTRLGLEKYGTAGEAFDPQIHEALLHDSSAEVLIPTATKILQSGYKFKDRVLRPARVAVTDPIEVIAE